MRRVGVLVLAATLILSACIKDPDSSTAPPVATTSGNLEMDLTSHAPFAVPPDDFIKNQWVTVVGGKEQMLPKWKTNWEANIERLTKYSKANGLAYADSYDDYRNKNFDKYVITKAPTTTDFRTPSEYEPMQAYMLAWRTSSMTGAWKTLFTEIIKGAWGVVPVILVYEDALHKVKLETELTALKYTTADIAKNVIWFKHQTNGIWVRDWGPIGIVDKPTTGKAKVSFVDFRYYHTRPYDDEAPTSLAKEWGVNVFRPDLDYEPGNFMTTTDGLCAATKGVLNYNLQFSQSAVEQIFKDYLACKKILFAASMTGGVISHIDMFAKFASDTTMIVGEYTATQHAANKKILDANATLFSTTPTPSAKKITVTRIPMPNIGKSGSTSIWRTYTNSTSLSNGTTKVLLIPTYSDETTNETKALAAYTTAFPGWKQVKIDSKIVIPGQGAIHCITKEIPVGARAKMETDPTHLCGAQKWICTKAICGNISAKGCCDGDTLKYCNGGKLAAENCATNPKCGWDTTKSWYACGTTGTADPAAKYVKNCGVLTDAPLPDSGPDQAPKLDKGGSAACGSVTYAGCCKGETVYYCDKGVLKNIDCSKSTTAPKCSWSAANSFYDCGTTGTADPSGKNPQKCTGTFPDQGAPKLDKGAGCGGISTEGCCDGEKIKYCDKGVLKTMDCTQSPKCGWDATNAFYDCGTSGSAEPSGKYPMACSAVKQDQGVPDQAAPTPDTGKPDLAAPDQGKQDKGWLPPDGGKTDPGDDDEGGCGSCSTGGGATPSLPAMLLVLGALLFVRRRS